MSYVLHESIKWVSSSIIFGQKVQNLSSLIAGGLLCLPLSIAKQTVWSLSRSFVSVRLCLLFLIRGFNNIKRTSQKINHVTDHIN